MYYQDREPDFSIHGAAQLQYKGYEGSSTHRIIGEGTLIPRVCANGTVRNINQNEHHLQAGPKRAEE